MTRARENLHLTYARSRRVWGQEEMRPPSRFLGEIPEHYTTTNSALKRPKFLDRYVDKFGVASEEEMDRAARVAPKPGRFNGGGKWSQRSTVLRRPQAPARNSSDDEMPDYENFGDDTFESGSSGGGYKKGDRVRHQIFGVGSIFQIEGVGDQQKVSVIFSDKALKKFMVKHARLEKV
jgi:DNA helicase-2/ATP-dependent DNA helicase PcrA